ncbi:MAG: ABC transporter permease, partial [Mesorhizobium sp.]
MDIQRLKPHFPWITLLVLVTIVGIADPSFLKPANLLSLAGDIVPLFIMALGLTFAIYIGGIDLSAQSMANMITVVASVYLAPLGIWVAALCILAGFMLGTLSGYLTTRMYVPSFISTLAVGGICFSVAQWLSGNRALNMDATQRNETFGWMIGRTGIVPHELFIAIGLLAICLLIERRTVLGR